VLTSKRAIPHSQATYRTLNRNPNPRTAAFWWCCCNLVTPNTTVYYLLLSAISKFLSVIISSSVFDSFTLGECGPGGNQNFRSACSGG